MGQNRRWNASIRSEFRTRPLLRFVCLDLDSLARLSLSWLATHLIHVNIAAQNTNQGRILHLCSHHSQMASIELPNLNKEDFEAHYNVGDRLGSYE